MRNVWRAGALALATSTLAVGGFAGAANAQPVITGGLVNVTVTNLLNDNTVNVQLPINAAANICGVDVAVLSQQLGSTPYTCTSRSGQQSLSITP